MEQQASKKQGIVTLSTTKVENVTGAEAAREVVWLKSLLIGLKVVLHASKPALHNNNMSVMEYSKNSKFRRRMKHTRIKHYFVRNKKEKMLLEHIPSGRDH